MKDLLESCGVSWPTVERGSATEMNKIGQGYIGMPKY
jgi:hypothetical protein